MAISMFKKDKKNIDGLTPSKAQQRAARTDTASLYTWMDNSIMALGASFDSWRYKDAPASEVTNCVEALEVIWSELERRKSK